MNTIFPSNCAGAEINYWANEETRWAPLTVTVMSWGGEPLPIPEDALLCLTPHQGFQKDSWGLQGAPDPPVSPSPFPPKAHES